MELEFKKKPMCCNKVMHKQEAIQQMIQEGKITQYVCLECGGYVTVTEGQLDKEELQNFKDTYGVEK